jgi:hypothetical protein
VERAAGAVGSPCRLRTVPGAPQALTAPRRRVAATHHRWSC